uniref:Uncharacterized protein n=1 Tax=Wuchereria bancrofti TaxID=6293 RepID=A0A1I8EMR1_WUCBA
MLNDDTSKVLLTTTIDNLICCSTDQISEKNLEVRRMMIYFQILFLYVINGQIIGVTDIAMIVQEFNLLQLVLGKCERNILSSELNFSQLPYAELPTSVLFFSFLFY